MKKFANKKRVQGLTFKKKFRVYLLRRTPNTKIIFFQITRPSNKLDFAKLKPFKIIRVLELVIYKLNFLDSMRIIKIYYILVLKLVDLEAPLIENIPNINSKSQKKVWKIKKILDSKLINNNKRKYFIK